MDGNMLQCKKIKLLIIAGILIVCLSFSKISCVFNPFKTKCNLFYTTTQCLPRSKHSPLRL
jgi:hypothetical protein